MKPSDIERMIDRQQFHTAIVTSPSGMESAPAVFAAIKSSEALGCTLRWLEPQRTLKIVLSSDQSDALGEAARSIRTLCEEHRWNLATFRDRTEAPELRIAVMDMDSTIINEEVIEELADFAGFRKEVTEITTAAMEGRLDFREALRERVALLKGQPASILEEVLENRITATPGLAEFIDGLHERGITTAVVSGGFLPIVEGFTRRYGIERCAANQLGIENGVLTGTVEGEIIDSAYKLRFLEELCRERRCDLSDALAVGDGANDLPMILASGLGVAFCAKAVVNEKAPAVIRNRRLDEILHFLC